MESKEINIGGIRLGQGSPPMIIAEMSGNHNQSLDRALQLIDSAAMSGVHGIKIQTYTADTMTIDVGDREFRITDDNSLWSGKSLYELYHEAHTPWEWHQAIFQRCDDHGLLCFSTPFDESAVDFLEELDVPCYKIASFENTDTQLLKKVASTGKPVIISTGMASIAELDETVRTVRSHGCEELVLLKCTSTYPASPEHSNIMTIPHMRELFNCHVGLSDHTHGIGVGVASVAYGAVLIEKHFTLRRDDGGVDAAFSMEPVEMQMLVEECSRAWQAVGNISYGPGSVEKSSMVFRRSLYITEDLAKGDILNKENLRAIRPGYGLPVKYIEQFLGKRVNRDLSRGTPLSWDVIG